ncbi:MAG: DUF4215 domain-containing protein [Myxococcota bacterium]
MRIATVAAVIGTSLCFAAGLVLAGCGQAEPAGPNDIAQGFADQVDTTAGCDGDNLCAGGFCVAQVCVECRAASDCPAQPALCAAGTCIPQAACSSDKQCAALGAVCDKEAAVCVACLTDQDCPENDSCKAHACQPPALTCASAKDCLSVNGVCDKVAGVCVDCLGDDDCVADRYCLESVCVPDQCPGGVAACADLVTRKTCSGNGGQWALESCVEGDACESGACKPVVCTPGQASCQQAKVAVCNPTGTGWAAGTACDPGYTCVGGGCVVPVCAAGTQLCGAGSIRTCRADGMGWDETSCGPASSGIGTKLCTTSAGVPACVDPVCTPGAGYCDGNLAKQCDVQGLSAATVDDCTKSGADGKPRTCVGGACVSTKCTPGTALCADGATLATCKTDGSGYQKTPCVEGQGCDGAKCSELLCNPGEFSCLGKVVQQCSSGGTAQAAVEDCAAKGKTCSNGACASQACQSGQTVCQDGFLSTCQSDGMGWQKSACAAGSVCVGTSCKVKVCAPGAAFCEGQTVVQCDATGTVKTNGENCQTGGKSCSDGKCVSLACVPLSKGCQGGGVGTCKADGSGWDVVACAQGQSCQTGECVSWVCAPGQGGCEGTKAYQCSSDGLQKGLVADCGATGKVCDKGSCVVSPCGNGVVEAGEQCDDGNTVDKDGCTSGCQYEGGKFVGYSGFDYIQCNKATTTEQDAKAHAACAAKWNGARAASVAAITFGLIEGLPAYNSYTSRIVPACPECLSSLVETKCKDGLIRRWVEAGKPWPKNLDAWDPMEYGLVTGIWTTVCIK